MKRDIDLVRSLLLAIEERFYDFVPGDLEARFGAPARDVIEHVHLLEQAGLIEIARRSLDGKFRVRGLTWAGHDFVETMRDPEVWKRTKDGASKMGGWTFDLLKDMGKAYLKHVAKERLGLEL